jgi:ATP/maltotriose-dependent transcriptional regulator MalT
MPALFLALARGNYAAATALGEQLLHLTMKDAPPAAQIFPYYGMACAALAQGDYVHAKSYAERSLFFAAAADMPRDRTFPHGLLGQIALAEGELSAAKRHFNAAYTINLEYGDRGGIAEHLANLAGVALLQHEWGEARGLYAASHTVYQEIGDRGGSARTALGMGIVSHELDELNAARHHFSRALMIALDAQIVPVLLSIAVAAGDFLLQTGGAQVLALRVLAFVLQHPSSDERTRQQALDALARVGRSADDLPESRDTLTSLTAALQTELAVPAGESLSRPNLNNQPLAEPLTDREIEVLQLLAGGRSNPEIAEALVVTVGTVKSHTSHIFRKLDVSNRTQAVLRARELGLLT